MAGLVMRVVSIGEVMVELSGAGPGLWRTGFAGDTFNTAWYLTALRRDWRVAYGTRLGRDAMSANAAAAIRDAGLLTDWLQADPVRSIGLYMISLSNGERSFTYWRDTSAARLLAEDPAWLTAVVGWADAVYLSGITLAILSPAARTRLIAALAQARAEGKRVIFDPNLRPRLWEDADTMRAAVSAAAAQSTLCLPSFDDEAAIFGDATPTATAQRYAALGPAEVVVKNGPGPLVLWSGGALQPAQAPQALIPVDTTGAGDSFNAGYIAARLGGASATDAIHAGQSLAALVVMHPGALVPAEAMARYLEATR